jgi:hypothetical protein
VQQWSSSGAAPTAEKGHLESHLSGRWRHCASRNVGVSEETLALTSDLIGRRVYKELADFDNHLDDITQDYLNVQMNMVIDQALSQILPDLIIFHKSSPMLNNEHLDVVPNINKICGT